MNDDLLFAIWKLGFNAGNEPSFKLQRREETIMKLTL